MRFTKEEKHETEAVKGTLVKELGINNINSNSPACVPMDDSFEAIIGSRSRFVASVGLGVSEKDRGLPYLCWTPKLHGLPCEHRFIAGSSGCAAKGLSCLLAGLLGAMGDGLVGCCGTGAGRGGVDGMWILKNSTSLLSSLDQLDVRAAGSVRAFGFSALCALVPHGLLGSGVSSLVRDAFGGGMGV